MKKAPKPWLRRVIWGLAAAGAVWALWALLGLPMSGAWLLALPTAGSILAFRGVWSLLSHRDRRKAEAGSVPKAPEPEPEAEAEEPPLTPEQQEVLGEGQLALKELGRLYARIRGDGVRSRILQLMDLTDRIVQDVRSDPTDLPMIRRFLRYYLPTDIRLLHEYDRMCAEGDGSRVEAVLDQAVRATRDQYDALFANDATDLELDIQAMESMLRGEGLAGSDFQIPT